MISPSQRVGEGQPGTTELIVEPDREVVQGNPRRQPRSQPTQLYLYSAACGEQDDVPRRDIAPDSLPSDGRSRVHLPGNPYRGLPDPDHPCIGSSCSPGCLSNGREDGKPRRP